MKQFFAQRPLLRIAWVHLFSKKRQTIVAMLGVMFGVTVFIFQAGLLTGLQTYFIEKTVNTTAHLHIFNDVRTSRPQVLDLNSDTSSTWNVVRNQKPRDEERRLRNGYQILRDIERDPRVEGVAPYLGLQGILRYGMSQQAATLAGVEILREDQLFHIKDNLVSGQLQRMETLPNGIILGFGLADKLGVRLDDNITVISSKGVALEMKVVGISKTGITLQDNTRAYVSIRNAQRLLQQSAAYITDINVRLRDVDIAQSVATEYSSLYRYKAEDWKAANANIFGIFRIQNLTVSFVIISILVVSGFGIFNILMTIIYEKMPDIAILKAMGYRDGDIRVIFLIESIAIGSTGGLLGLLLGFIASKIVGMIPLNIQGFVSVQYLIINFNPLFYLAAFCFALTATTVAGYFPARKAARFDPVEIIRSR
ncbi:MAG: ABC transporter permease [Candidatus Kapabacteria bacterium]|nr:ABC transporter permease [Candidatus Kapabacteria bacterium]